VNLALSDAPSVHAMVALAAYHQTLARQKTLQNDDWKAKEVSENGLANALSHLIEATRLLNEKLQDPKTALSNSSLFCAAMLGTSSVS
jgi:hypothetical protein